MHKQKGKQYSGCKNQTLSKYSDTGQQPVMGFRACFQAWRLSWHFNIETISGHCLHLFDTPWCPCHEGKLHHMVVHCVKSIKASQEAFSPYLEGVVLLCTVLLLVDWIYPPNYCHAVCLTLISLFYLEVLFHFQNFSFPSTTAYQNDLEITPLTLSGYLITFKTYAAQTGAEGGDGCNLSLYWKMKLVVKQWLAAWSSSNGLSNYNMYIFISCFLLER